MDDLQGGFAIMDFQCLVLRLGIERLLNQCGERHTVLDNNNDSFLWMAAHSSSWMAPIHHPVFNGRVGYAGCPDCLLPTIEQNNLLVNQGQEPMVVMRRTVRYVPGYCA